jgi:uncharacterized membrane-anchored protein YitT (DUF2179 family)
LLVGLAGLIGIGYLLKMHISRLVKARKGSFYSAIVLILFLVTVGAGFILSPQDVLYRNWVLNLVIPVETSLLALLSVTLLSASLYFIRTRGWTLMSVSFLVSALVSLVLKLAYIDPQSGTMAAEWVNFIRRLPITGIRGILIGMALGGLVVGLRVLLAVDRPYNGEK